MCRSNFCYQQLSLSRRLNFYNVAIFLLVINILLQQSFSFVPLTTLTKKRSLSSFTDTSLNFLFSGGADEVEVTINGDPDSGELVHVRIERTSQNSRRIGSEIVVDAPINDVWAILTDYDNLSTHVPNLVESRRLRSGTGQQGDGSYQCRLFQKGAQNIIGFEFGASVTMDMTEKESMSERKIEFRCVDSYFFSEFDGEWRVSPTADGLATTLNYVVDVRPKGPVPVAALEWRIREDVPTNLRAVKKAALKIGGKSRLLKKPVIKSLNKQTASNGFTQDVKSRIRNVASVGSERAKAVVGSVMSKGKFQPIPKLVPVQNWDDEETMAVYLREL